MTSSTGILGMAWDHPRALLPLRAISSGWSEAHKIAVKWDARPLVAFEDQPLEELANAYDLVLIDHPFVGVAAQSGLIAPVEDWVDEAYLADQKCNSVGPSYPSYTCDDRQWALAIDAACQVGAVRRDLWNDARLGAFPRTWDQVAATASDLKHSPSRVAVALNPNHAYCAFLAVSVTLAGDAFWPDHGRFKLSAAEASLNFLKQLASDLHPASLESDPIALSDLMSSTDEVALTPLMFGYSSYARPDFRDHVLHFIDAPTGPSGRIGSVLGGVGVALSARSAHRESAADLARLLADPATQAGVYTTSGGQPGHDAAWRSPDANALVGDFFGNTRRSMQDAFIRPRIAGHRRFQELAGRRINHCLRSKDDTPQACVRDLNDLTVAFLRPHEAEVSQ